MDEFIKVIAPALPPWVVWPAAGIAALVFLWSKAQSIWIELVPWRRTLSREKLRLEVVKLRYEIDALKRQHQLPTIPEDVPEDDSIAPSRPDVVLTGGIGFWQRVLWGALGSLIPRFLPFMMGDARNAMFDLFELMGYAIAAIILCVVVGLLVALWGPSRRRLDTFALGALVALALSQVLALLPHQQSTTS